MFKTIQGVYKNGTVELLERPSHVPDETRVMVTFLEPAPIDLRARGMDESHAAELRSRLATFAEDWERPEMSAYDNYDAHRARM